MKNIFSIDVEDWFHILDLPTAPDVNAWHTKESRVEKNLNTILDLLDHNSTKATLFVLGWVAEKYPNIIKEAQKRGHEIASHGYAHQLVYGMKPEEFFQDILKAKSIIETITGDKVLGHRAPGFSITPETPWAFEMLAKAGYVYDSSVFPTKRAHGGFLGAELSPHQINTKQGPIIEFPISMANVLGTKVCFFGGGYFRLFPWALIKAKSEQVNFEGRPVVYYIHPRDIDPHQPRLPMSFVRRFKSYVNLHSTEEKLLKLIQSQTLTSFSEWLTLANLPLTKGPLKSVAI